MKWSRLQLNTLPLIAIEADKAIEKLECMCVLIFRAYYKSELEC